MRRSVETSELLKVSNPKIMEDAAVSGHERFLLFTKFHCVFYIAS